VNISLLSVFVNKSAVQFLLFISWYLVSTNECLSGVGVETLERIPKLLQPSHQLSTPLVKDKRELCIHETRWTEAALKELHQDLKGNKPN
jgi:hypothetical protein